MAYIKIDKTRVHIVFRHSTITVCDKKIYTKASIKALVSNIPEVFYCHVSNFYDIKEKVFE